MENKFFSYLEKTASCWNWKGRVSGSKIYGQYGDFWDSNRKRTVKAHRFSYELHKTQIPHGMHLDHLCRNTLCVNPDHLEAVTPRENILRGIGRSAINKRKTHCAKNHSYEEFGVLNKKGHRLCYECCRLKSREYRKRKPYKRRIQIYDAIKSREKYLAKKRENDPNAIIDYGRLKECKKGHPFDEKNTYVASSGDRICKQCRKEYHRIRYIKKKALL